MNLYMNELIEKWEQCNLNSPPFIFPGDKISNGQTLDCLSFEEFVNEHDGTKQDQRFHTGLVPIPYMGSLRKGTIFILMLNPGFHPGDYFAEYNNKSYKQAIMRNLYQQNDDEKYPFLFLDPQFAWHPGHSYWHRKLWGILHEIQTQKRISYQEASSLLAQRIVSLELIPYHSKTFGISRNDYEQLKSADAMRRYVEHDLTQRATSNEILIIVTRKIRAWNINTFHENIVIYEGNESRAAHLSPGSSGGKRIMKHLDLKISE